MSPPVPGVKECSARVQGTPLRQIMAFYEIFIPGIRYFIPVCLNLLISIKKALPVWWM